jgi:integrase
VASSPLTFHALHHSAASLMLASGADIAGVSKLMGHASIAITAYVYSLLVDTIAQKPWTVPRT